jgi:ATP-dependent exoDNAse (exonuclease V) alpha subunit
MLGKKTMQHLDKRLKEASGKRDQPFGGFSIVFVGDFQQFPPVGDTAIYIEDDHPSSVLYSRITNIVELEKCERHDSIDPDRDAFAQILERCAAGTLQVEDWDVIKTRFDDTAVDRNDERWKTSTKLFYDNDSVDETNLDRLVKLNKPIARLNAVHNKPAAAAMKSQNAGGLRNKLYLSIGSNVMLTSNLWTDVGLHNGAKGTVEGFVYATSEGPGRNGTLPNAVVVSFPHLNDSLPSYFEHVPKTLAIPPQLFSWSVAGRNHFMSRTQVPLQLAWSSTFHKVQGRTLNDAYIDLGRKEYTPGMTLVALSRVRRLSDLLLVPFSCERFQKAGTSPACVAIRSALEKLRVKAHQTELRYAEQRRNM